MAMTCKWEFFLYLPFRGTTEPIRTEFNNDNVGGYTGREP